MSDMDDAIAAGDGTLHGAIDYWQDRARKAEEELDAARADLAAARALLFDLRNATCITWHLSRAGRAYLARIDAALAGKKE